MTAPAPSVRRVPEIPRSQLARLRRAGGRHRAAGRALRALGACGRSTAAAPAGARRHVLGGRAARNRARRGSGPASGRLRARPGARVQDAVRRAGGARHGANLDAVNLAARVADGQQIVVPAAAAAAAASRAGADRRCGRSGSAGQPRQRDARAARDARRRRARHGAEDRRLPHRARRLSVGRRPRRTCRESGRRSSPRSSRTSSLEPAGAVSAPRGARRAVARDAGGRATRLRCCWRRCSPPRARCSRGLLLAAAFTGRGSRRLAPPSSTARALAPLARPRRRRARDAARPPARDAVRRLAGDRVAARRARRADGGSVGRAAGGGDRRASCGRRDAQAALAGAGVDARAQRARGASARAVRATGAARGGVAGMVDGVRRAGRARAGGRRAAQRQRRCCAAWCSARARR